MLLEKEETAEQWGFIIITGVLLLLTVGFWGRHSDFRIDKHAARARKVLQGLQAVCRLEKRCKIEGRTFETWVRAHLDDSEFVDVGFRL